VRGANDRVAGLERDLAIVESYRGHVTGRTPRRSC
jgi:hypothetical protein